MQQAPCRSTQGPWLPVLGPLGSSHPPSAQPSGRASLYLLITEISRESGFLSAWCQSQMHISISTQPIMDRGKINQYAFPHFPTSVCLMQEIAAARDLEIQWVFFIPLRKCTWPWGFFYEKKKKKVKAETHNDSLFLSVFQRENWVA